MGFVACQVVEYTEGHLKVKVNAGIRRTSRRLKSSPKLEPHNNSLAREREDNRTAGFQKGPKSIH